jgi:hypothetical protein
MNLHENHAVVFVYGGISVRVWLAVITPADAREMLERNVHNRPLTKSALVRLQRAIGQDEWQLNGATIVLDDEGTVLDGQHRLIACVNADKPIVSLIAQGLPVESQATMDTGGAGSRNLAQFLAMPPDPEKSATQLAAALGVIHRVRNGGMKRQSTTYPSIIEATEILAAEPNIRGSLPVGKRANHALKIPAGLAAALHYLFSEVDGEAADDYFSILMSGAGLEETDPLFVLRKKLEQRAAKRHDRERQEVVGAWMIKAWNWWLEGRAVSRIYWVSGGPKAETFPQIEAPEGYGDSDEGGAA